MQQTGNRGDGAARQGAVQAGCVAQRAARMGMRGPAALACLCGALLLAACGGGGPLATAVPQATELAGAGNTAPITQPTGTGTPSGTDGGTATTETPGSLPAGYAPDGTLPPPPSTGPRSQNARGMTRAMIDEWNATCTDQPTCRIDQAQIDAYNRDVCDAFYPDDAGCYIGQ